ncbi:MAG TPA: hypothetical protein VE219_04315, partial [Candidatus Sulfotelmatobacter sp.]|nr:hypothetical protein [Candidatus Sulfotelmatobacter sp.]
MSGLTVIDYMEEVASRALGNPATDRCEPSSARVFTEQAAAHTQMGRNLAPQERMRWAKKLVLRVAHLFSKEQVVFNEKTVDALREVDATLRAAHQQSAAAQLRASLLDERIDTLERDGLGGVRSAIDGIARSLEGIARTQEAMRAELSMVRSRLRSDANEAITPALLRPQTNEDGAIEEESLDSLYMNFEHRFRGSSIDIKERQR